MAIRRWTGSEAPQLVALEAVYRAEGPEKWIGSPGCVAKLVNQKSAIKLLERHGWTKTVGGKHVKMTKDGHAITLPPHKGQDYSRGLTSAILKQAGIDRSEL